MEDTLRGLPGISEVSLVVEELNCAIDSAPIRGLQTEEHHAGDLLKKHGYVDPIAVKHKMDV